MKSVHLLVLMCAPSLAYACASDAPVDHPDPTPVSAASVESGSAASAPEKSAPPSARDDAVASAAPAQDKWTQEELEAVAREIQVEIEELRGEKFLRPVAVKLASKEDFVAYAKARLAMTETPEKLAADETMAKLLGVIAPDANLIATLMDLLEDQVGGYYDPASDSFSLMQGFPRDIARVIMAHELDHALDDQLFSIDSRLDDFATNSDAGLAYHAVVEGSGTSVMNAWTMKHAGEIDLAAFGEMQKEMQDSMTNAPAWLWKPLLASYLQGAAFLARTDSLLQGQMKAAKNEDIARAFREPPTSSEQILHPKKYWEASERDDPVRVAFETSALGEGWKVLREDTLGELALAIVSSPPSERGGLDMSNPMAVMSLSVTNTPAEGWEGDRVLLLEFESGRVLRLVTLWESERDAGEFFGALEILLPSVEQTARDWAGPGAKENDSDATLEYGENPNEVVLTVRANVDRVEVKKLLKKLKHSVASSG